MKFLNKLSDLAGKYMAWLTILFAGVGLFLPGVFLPLTKVKVGTMSLTNILLGVIMFGMGMTLKPDDFKLLLKRPRDVLVSILGQYTIMPLGAFLIAKVLRLDPALAFGLVLLGCVPGGTASNVMTFLAKGDVPLSVTTTMCTTLLAPVLTPALCYLLGGEWVQVDFWSMLQSIVMVVLIPIVAGVLVHMVLGERCEKIKKLLVLISVVSIVVIVGMCVAPNAEKFLQVSSVLVIVAVLLHHLLGLSLGYLLCKLLHMDEKKVRALSIEVGLQNSGLAVGLAGGFSASYPMAVLPSAIATVVHQIVGSLVANFFASRKLSEEKAEEAVKETAPVAAHN